MTNVNADILVKCNETRQIDVRPTGLDFYQVFDRNLAVNTGGYDIGIECMDYTIYDSCKIPEIVADYIKHDSIAIVKAFDSWCMSNLIKRVIFSDPCTIVIWSDGTKTIVRCTDEKFDKEKGLAMCIAKKALGNKGKYYDVFKKWIEEE